ncbi:5'-nucleotidase/UDP-sugar diphosphatase [Clostridiales Family XIII bacterium PM5-7]
MRKKRFLVTLLTICMALSMMPAISFAADEPTPAKDIVVLFTNDTHCGLTSGIGFDGLSAYKADKIAEVGAENVTLVDAGDALQGDQVGTLSKGASVVDIMNKVGYDIAIPGNHEFDYSMEQFFTLVKSANATYISSNFMDLTTGKSVLAPYAMKTYGTKKVAYVGISTPESITKSTPAFFQNADGKYIYDFCNDLTGRKLYANVQASVNAAKKEGADYIIAIGHMGIDSQSKPWTSKDVIANTTGIDAFIDGHSHSVINEQVANKEGKKIPLAQTGSSFQNIGQLTISADGTITPTLISAEDYTKKDATTTAFIKDITDKIAALINRVIGTSSIDLSINDADGNRLVRKAETGIGNFCADAFKVVAGADIGIIQGGGIRASVLKGDITYGDILKLYPYGNNFCVIEATGQQILNMLEMAARTCPDENGGFMHVAGLTYEIDTTKASTVVTNELKEFVKVSGARRVSNVKVNGVSIDPAKKYTVASTDYILTQGGDGMTMFKDCKNVTKDAMSETEAVSTYINATLKGTIGEEYAKTQGRIKVITADEKAPITAYKNAKARKTKISSAKVYKKKITVKITGNSKAYGFYYKTVNAKGKVVSYKTTPSKSYTSKKLVKGKYTVKVTPYTYVVGEKVYGKTVTKKVTIK